VDDVNRQIQKYAAANRRVTFVDVNPALFNADGSPRRELFMNDGLHLRAAAYEEFARILKPVLAKALAPQAVR
jgi:lysophospholipase L1-like esterase